MARIAGIDLPKNKRGVIGWTYIFGIGLQSSRDILDKACVDRDTKVMDWNDDEWGKIGTIIHADLKTEGELRGEYQLNINRLMDVGCDRGIRNRKA